MLIGFTLLALLLAFIHAVIYLRGDLRRDLRRCPRCRYDMTRVPGMTCPECGHAAPREAAFHYTRRRRRFALMAAFWLVVGAGLFISGSVRHGLVGMLPRPVLAWALELSVPVPPTAPGADIPALATAPALPAWRASLWSRLSWNQNYVHAVRAWGDLVATDDPAKALADLPRIHAALREMKAWDERFGGTAWVDAWVASEEIDRQRRRIEGLAARVVSIPGPAGGAVTLDRNELLMLAFQPSRNVAGGVGLRGGAYVAAPQAYLAAMAATADPEARRYALERLGPEPSGAVDIDALLARVETGDPDQKTRDAAATIRLWRASLLKSVR